LKARVEAKFAERVTRCGSTFRPVFIGGCPRSGTTLLGAMLGNGPERLTVPEALFKFTVLPKLIEEDGQLSTRLAVSELANDDFFQRWGVTVSTHDLPPRIPAGDLVHCLVEAFGRKEGKPSPVVWIDHTPGNIRYAAILDRTFPNSRFINLLRDGRAVAASVLPLDWGPNTIAEAARWWAMHIAVGMAAERALGSERVLTVRYEEIVRDPELILPKICSFLDLRYHERMIDNRDYDAKSFTATDQRLASQPPDPTRAVAWQRQLSASQVELFEHLSWELLDLLGYDMVYGAAARMAPRRVRLAAFANDIVRRGLTDRIRRRRRPGPRRS
jgi:Sulfotransferase family